MQKFAALASSLAVLVAAPALAGGYVAPAADVEPMVTVTPAPVVGSWTGGYLGANVNYGKADSSGSGDLFDPEDPDPIGTASFSSEPDGASAALRGGYDWQRGNGVFGIGAEYNVGKYKGDYAETLTPTDEGDALSVTGEARLKNVGTVFLRAGYAFSEQLMTYGLLGYSWGKVEASAIYDEEVWNFSRSVDGPTIGLGAEYRFNPNWSGYAEYAYTDFGDITADDGISGELDLNQVKLGVNFRF